ncbi:Ig-like domain-containing protein [Paenibacillus sp. LHD-117]|uniref:Ig-like domain-containing protein n=1 Tax=Paenibacillus sp. LHD-117 TaxID=3071412 RepID=UPI0027DF5946|nr:Ig-like domain-containing protein [Paenibacillus sp. LHD-117]MDQ6423617.1 Ig-like domain-containing protein [Paenibacillus sp. LHD-117]
MRKIALALLALTLLLGLSVPIAGAATLTTEEKFQVLKQKGIMSGFEDGSSRLNESMTREQFATVLYKLLELPRSNTAPKFADVLKTRWSFEAVQAVRSAGLMVGKGDNRFAPTAPVKVEELAVVMVKVNNIPVNPNIGFTGKVSAWAKAAVGTALSKAWIAPRNDYTVDATRGVLVEAVYAVYSGSTSTLDVRSVEGVNVQMVRVNLKAKTDSADIGRFSLRDDLGNVVPIIVTTISGDGLQVLLTTGIQFENRTHYLTIDGQSWAYVSPRSDMSKPIITALDRLAPRLYVLTFSEPVDHGTATNPANYSFSGGLKLTTLQLSSDKRQVTFSTSNQSDNARYWLTVKNIKDLAGNVMDTRSDLSIVGSNDATKPTIIDAEFRVNEDASLTVKFSEKMNRDIAAQTGRYSINGLAIVSATVDNEGRVVTLRTSAQQDKTLYSLSVSGIPDLAGNVMDTKTGLLFGGISNPVLPVKLQSIAAVNENTIEITFDRAIRDEDVGSLAATILKDNGANVSMSGWSKYAVRKPGTDRVVTVQFRTGAEANPNLFRAGHVYTARITGVASLLSQDAANETAFAGTIAVNEISYAKQVIVLNRTTIKVVFSEPVKNVNEPYFAVKEQGGDAIGISHDELNNTGAVVTEVTLKLAKDMTPGKVYVLTFKPGITDAAGFNGWQTKNGNEDISILFTGV